MRNKEWSLPLIENIIKHLLEITMKQNVEELKNAKLLRLVWKELEKKVHVNWEHLRYFWLHQLHMQLFCPSSIYRNNVKIKIIKYLQSKGITKSSEINWKNAVTSFDGYTSDFLSATFHSLKLMKYDYNGNERKKLPHESKRLGIGKFIDNLYHKHINTIMKQQNDDCLPRFSYIDGKLEAKECMSYNG